MADVYQLWKKPSPRDVSIQVDTKLILYENNKV